MARAKLFMNGRSQAVRLPKAFRFPGTEVSIRKVGKAVILEPIEKRSWPVGFFEAVRFGDDDGFDLPEDDLMPEIEPLDPLPAGRRSGP